MSIYTYIILYIYIYIYIYYILIDSSLAYTVLTQISIITKYWYACFLK